MREARALGLLGWVRNLGDGDVEVLAEGRPEDLAAFRAWLEEGPPGASVRSVREEKRDPSGLYSDFSVEF
jgi:acylphosphatase